MTPAEWAVRAWIAVTWPHIEGESWFPEPTPAEIAAALAMLGKVREELDASEEALRGLDNSVAERGGAH